MISRSFLIRKGAFDALGVFPLFNNARNPMLPVCSEYHHKAKDVFKPKSDGRRQTDWKKDKVRTEIKLRNSIKREKEAAKPSAESTVVTDEQGRLHAVVFENVSTDKSKSSSALDAKIRSVTTLSSSGSSALAKVKESIDKRDFEGLLKSLEDLSRIERRDIRLIDMHAVFPIEYLSSLKVDELCRLVRSWSSCKAFDCTYARDSKLLLTLLQQVLKSPTPVSYKFLNDILRGLSDMKFHIGYVPTDDLTQLYATLNREIPRCKSSYLSNLLRNLGGMECRWSALPPGLSDVIVKAIQKNIFHFDIKTGSMLLYALSKMELDIGYESDAFRAVLVDIAFNVIALFVDKECTETNSPFLGQSVLGMARIKLKLSHLDAEFQALLVDNVDKMLPVLGTRVANVIFSFGTMGLKWSEQSENFKESIQTHFLQHVGYMERSDLIQSFRGFHAMLGNSAMSESDLKTDVKIKLRQIQIQQGI